MIKEKIISTLTFVPALIWAIAELTFQAMKAIIKKLREPLNDLIY